MKLLKSLNAFHTNDFNTILKSEIQLIDKNLLPLQQGLSFSSAVGPSSFSAVILRVTDTEKAIQATTGIFYSGIIAGCNCSDDPSPSDEQNEYCELQFVIDKSNAETHVTLLAT